MASVGFGSTMAAVAPASSSSAAGRKLRRTQLAVAPAATKGTQAAPKKEKGILDFIVGAIFKEDQLLVETDPLLNKIDAPAPSSGGTASRKAGGTASGGKKPAADGGDGGGGFKLGGLFAKKG